MFELRRVRSLNVNEGCVRLDDAVVDQILHLYIDGFCISMILLPLAMALDAYLPRDDSS